MRAVSFLAAACAVLAARSPAASPLRRHRAPSAPLARVSFGALPPVGSYVGLEPIDAVGMGLRHCDYVSSVCPSESGNDDFRFKIVKALNGECMCGGVMSDATEMPLPPLAMLSPQFTFSRSQIPLGDPAPAFSLQSANFPDQYLSPVAGNANGAIGINAGPPAADATWRFIPGLADPTNYSLASVGKAGRYVGRVKANNAPCHYSAPSGDVVLTDGSDAVAATFIVGAPPPPPLPPTTINVTASAAASTHRVNPYFIGCHTDPVSSMERRSRRLGPSPPSRPPRLCPARHRFPLPAPRATRKSPAAGTRSWCTASHLSRARRPSRATRGTTLRLPA